MRNACASIFFGAMVALVSASVVADNKVRFNRDVLPILAENCYACHGADEASREADFRLDKRDLVILDRDGTHAIVPGRPEKSELWNRIVCRDLQRVMPPTKSSRQLNDAQREVLCRWISEGAAQERHWAYIPPQSVEPPDMPREVSAIDRFRNGLLPALLQDPLVVMNALL